MNELYDENERLKSDYETLKLQEADCSDYVRELMKENEQLKQSNKDAIQIIKKEFDFAHEQRQKYLNEVFVATAYDIIRYTMREALKKLGDFE